ncbi:M48 family metalloprotease [Sphingomicrobium flavum]|uniref:M48 family metalloprotease n=1 Tax=Sphingomicrobium flavum TaxID=1229164 RepID=UPI0021ADE6FC|nr:M48 family metalloprotease [Sphingomicrobium flavum]
MAEAQGFVTHVANNRRVAIELTLLYLIAFQLVGAFVIGVFLWMFDYSHMPFVNPLGYLLRYGWVVLLLSGAYLVWHYRRHAYEVKRKLGIRIASRASEPRFVTIAEQAAIAAGVRLPRFGVFERKAMNALTVGESADRGLIAVSRGLLHGLDDDELLAVLTHEFAHIRQGDTRLLALNHALEQTGTSMAMENPFRIDHWAVFIFIFIFPPSLFIFVAGHLATLVAKKLAWHAKGKLRVRRDYLADAEVVRLTHNPAALISALRKISGNSRFPGSMRVEGMLYSDNLDRSGIANAPIEERIAKVEKLARDLMEQPRSRRDTRQAFLPPIHEPMEPFERWLRYDDDGRPLERPPNARQMQKVYMEDREHWYDWRDACKAYWDWRPEDQRNFMGLKPDITVYFLIALLSMGTFYTIFDGSLEAAMKRFDPNHIVEMGRQYGVGGEKTTFCSGSPDGKCAD